MTQEIPESVMQDFKDLRAAEGVYDDLMYRIGTHGEKGLYPQRSKNSTLRKKLKQKIAAAGYKLTYKSEYPHWYFVTDKKS